MSHMGQQQPLRHVHFAGQVWLCAQVCAAVRIVNCTSGCANGRVGVGEKAGLGRIERGSRG